jgi:hypothetical protein
MNKALCLLLFFVIIAASYELTSLGDSDYFTMDTVAPELTLISPNGGEAWYIGDINNILWTATDTNLNSNGVFEPRTED